MDALLLLAFVLACPILVILTGVLLLYGIPVRFTTRVIIQEGDLRESVTVTWGLVGVRIRNNPQGTTLDLIIGGCVLYTYVFLPEGDVPPVPGKKEESDEEKKTPAHINYNHMARLARMLFRPSGALLSIIWHECRFDTIQGKITLGTGDPVLTGELYGYYWATRFMFEAMRIHVELEPVFDCEVFSCDLEVKISLHHPLLILIAAARLVLHPAAREMIVISRQGAPGVVAA